MVLVANGQLLTCVIKEMTMESGFVRNNFSDKRIHMDTKKPDVLGQVKYCVTLVNISDFKLDSCDNGWSLIFFLIRRNVVMY